MDTIPLYIHAMKEPDNVMMLMLTYGMLLSIGETKNGISLWMESRKWPSLNTQRSSTTTTDFKT